MSARVRESVLDPDTVRALNGDLIPDPAVPRHNWRCDGTGRTNDPDPLDRVPLVCPVCRPPDRLRRPARRGRTPIR